MATVLMLRSVFSKLVFMCCFSYKCYFLCVPSLNFVSKVFFFIPFLSVLKNIFTSVSYTTRLSIHVNVVIDNKDVDVLIDKKMK